MVMVNLSLWDIATTFSLDEAAALIAGMEPGAVESKQRAKPIRDRLYGAYQSAKAWHLDLLNPDQQRPLDGLVVDSTLHSVGMGYLVASAKDGDARYRLYQWLIDDDRSDAELQKFHRDELGRWLKFVGVKSAFFDRDLESTADKPLAPRERDTLLTIIGALLVLLKDTRPNKPDTSSQSKIKKLLLENYDDKNGISPRTLDEKFALASKVLTRL
jgi:hypothetical protein